MNIKFTLISLTTCLVMTGCSTLDKAILGMPLERTITPESVKKYNSPQELINGERLNGDSAGVGRLYKPNLNQVIIPYKYFQSLCIAQGGRFYPILIKNSPYIGSYECQNNKNQWAVNIEETSRTTDGIYLSSNVLDNTTLRIYKSIKEDNEKEKLKVIQAQKTREIAAQQQYQQHLLKNAPKASDIGATVCKDTNVNEYTGMIVLGQPQYREIQNARVIANLESMGNGNQNIKLNIKGWLNHNGGISSGPGVVYNQTPLESGRVIWDNKKDWYKCNY
ncbi:hypothetical protein [Acinetobacter johnsonii]|uniref:hypothetical protein n=1 Tax=Acinetobacter johnsonii TaxID=40214 RepID=UPI003AF54A3B